MNRGEGEIIMSDENDKMTSTINKAEYALNDFADSILEASKKMKDVIESALGKMFIGVDYGLHPNSNVSNVSDFSNFSDFNDLIGWQIISSDYIHEYIMVTLTRVVRKADGRIVKKRYNVNVRVTDVYVDTINRFIFCSTAIAKELADYGGYKLEIINNGEIW